MNLDYRSEYWLYDQYWNKKRTLKQMAKICGVCEHAVWYWMSKFGIARRTRKEVAGGKLPKGEASFNAFYKRYKWSARQRGLVFELSKKELREIVEQNCFYCGVSPNTRHIHSKETHGAYYSNGIDRIRSGDGYTRENSRPCCIRCNRAKHTMGEDEFYLFVISIYNHFILGEENVADWI